MNRLIIDRLIGDRWLIKGLTRPLIKAESINGVTVERDRCREEDEGEILVVASTVDRNPSILNGWIKKKKDQKRRISISFRIRCPS